MRSDKRIIWMDYARVFAIIFVIICHVIETDYYGVRIKGERVSDSMWFFQNIFFTIGRFGVPLFLMISGALMLDREYSAKKFYIRSFLPLLLTTEIWTIINYFYYCVQYSKAFQAKNLIYQMLFLTSSPLNHMWYMPMILGVYLIIPLLAKALKNTSFKDVLFPMAVSFCVFSLFPLFNAYSGEVVSSVSDIGTVFNVAFLGGWYGIFIVLGHFIKKDNIFEKMPTPVLLFLFIICFGLNTFGARFFYTNNYFHSDIYGWYTSPFIIAASIILFELIKRIPFNKSPKIITLISKGSFAIYLMHNLFLSTGNILFDRLNLTTKYDYFLLITIRFVVSFGLPLLIVFIANMLPFKKTKKLLLYMK